MEGVITEGALQVFAIFDKPDPLVGPFFEETIYVTPSRVSAERQGRIGDAVQRAAMALGLGHGPIHAECRVTPAGEVYVLEVAARPIGGLCSRVLAFKQGGRWRPCCSSTRLDARSSGLAARASRRGGDDDPDPASRNVQRRDAASSRRAEVAGVTDIRITAKEGQLLEPLPEAGSYLGFIFARGETPADAEAAVRRAHQTLKFSIVPEISLAARPT